MPPALSGIFSASEYANEIQSFNKISNSSSKVQYIVAIITILLGAAFAGVFFALAFSLEFDETKALVVVSKTAKTAVSKIQNLSKAVFYAYLPLHLQVHVHLL